LTDPPNFKADASIPVKSLPSPINFVAVTMPANVACPFVSIVTPVPTLMPLRDVSNFFTLLKYKSTDPLSLNTA
jgi:hypothetical protein